MTNIEQYIHYMNSLDSNGNKKNVVCFPNMPSTNNNYKSLSNNLFKNMESPLLR